MIALFIALPALAGAGIAIVLRRALARLSFIAWLGAALIGTGLPLLIGQLIFLALAGPVQERIDSCEAAGGMDCGEATIIVVGPLVAGLSAGLGWLAGAVTALFSKR